MFEIHSKVIWDMRLQKDSKWRIQIWKFLHRIATGISTEFKSGMILDQTKLKKMKIFLKIVDSSFFRSSHRVYRYFHVTRAPLNYPVERVRLKVDALDSRLLRNTNAPLTFKYDLYDMSHTTCLFIEIVLRVTFKPKSHRSFNPYWQIVDFFPQNQL